MKSPKPSCRPRRQPPPVDPASSEVAQPEGEYEVGYGRPPVHSRFKPGTSGNPKGRSKGTRNLATALERAFSEKVPIVDQGRRRKISKGEAAAKQLVNKAASGDLKALSHPAIQTLLTREPAAGAEQMQLLSETERLAGQHLLERLRRSVAQEPAAVQPSPEKSDDDSQPN